MTARVVLPGRPVQICPVRDLGLGGLYVESAGWLRLGQTCTVELRLSAAPESPEIPACGRVVRVEPGEGTAVQFTELSIESFDRLDHIVFAMDPASGATPSQLDLPFKPPDSR